jgi:membrane protease YdiL (CAAX protease family)
VAKNDVPVTCVFDGVRQAPPWLLAVLILVNSGLLVAGNLLLTSTAGRFIFDLHATTHGLVAPNLVLNSVHLAIVASIIFCLGRLCCNDVGWRAKSLPAALAMVCGMWLAMNLGLAASAWLSGGEPCWNSLWRERPGYALGNWLGGLLGTGLKEETIYRGLLLPQFFLLTRWRCGPRLAMAAALIASQALFAIGHLPAQAWNHQLTGTEVAAGQVRLFVMGLVFAGVYLATGNLFVVVGLHTLVNDSAPLVEVSHHGAVEFWLGISLLAMLGLVFMRGRIARRTSPGI